MSAEMLSVVLMLIITAAGKVEGVEIYCERAGRLNRFVECCFVNKSTIIGAYDVTVAGLENPVVQAIYFSGNKNIEFLPLSIYKKFPNLEAYLAKGSAVKEISALNFARLLNLKSLDLSCNQIEFIPDDCFHGLTKLYKIDLSMKA